MVIAHSTLNHVYLDSRVHTREISDEPGEGQLLLRGIRMRISCYVCFVPCSPLVGLVDGSDDEDVEDDHNAARHDPHEDEVGEENVVLWK